ncbi:MAG: translation initiation factor [Ginsengibacter sp.]
MAKKKLYSTTGIVYSTEPGVVSNEGEADEMDTLPAGQQLLTVKLDAKQRAGKLVTLITGFIGKNADLEKLGKELKFFCGTGGSVKNHEILVQGDNKEKVLQWLHKKGYTKARKA